jgi:beta-glucanase (GH16 family)
MKDNPEASMSANPTADSKTLFFDDFTAPGLDRSVWNVETTGQVYNNEQQAYVDSAETIYTIQAEPGANGALVLQPRWQPGFQTAEGKSFDFISGRIHTRKKVSFTYGRVAARILLPRGEGVWPAFWALGNGSYWPECGELDIMEYVGEADWVSAAVHGPNYSGETPLVNKKFFQPPDSVAAWHIYSMDCTAERLLFHVDGELIYRATRPMVEFYGQWVFEAEKYLLLNFALGGNYPLKTNGIREPYYGLPAATVRAIQNNETRMLVDWVKITSI